MDTLRDRSLLVRVREQPLLRSNVVILVIGGTGRTGRRIVDNLLARGERLRLLLRPTSTVPPAWDVERAVGDLNDCDSLRRAMSDVDAVFVLSPMDPLLDRMEAKVFDAALDRGVEHVIKMSTTKPEPDSPIPWWRAHWRAENALRNSGLRWTILRPNGISFFLLGHAETVRDYGELRTAAGDGRMALIDADDIGAVAAAVFADRNRYEGTVLDLTGPAAVSYDDVAEQLTALSDRHISHVDISPEDARGTMLASGVAEWEAEGTIANWKMTRDGSGGFDRVTNDVERVAARRPFALERFLSAHRHLFVPAR